MAALLLAGCMTGAGEPGPTLASEPTPATVNGLMPTSVTTAENRDDRHLVIMLPHEGGGARAAIIAAIAREYPVRIVESWPFASIAMQGIVFEVEAGHQVDAVRGRLARDPRIALVQPLHWFEPRLAIYDDALLAAQESLVDIDVLPAHHVATGRGVRVAVIDSGIDLRHPDLVSRVQVTRDFVAASTGGPMPERHGTAVAGVIGARADNGVGIVGMAPDAQLIGLRSCSEDGTVETTGCSGFALARALDFAILEGVDVINLSLAGPFDPLLARLIERALRADTLVVAAQASPDSFPASVQGVLAVAASRLDLLAGGEASGATLWAPGIDVLTTVPDAGYDFLSGSSLAAAHVSGLMALLREIDPSLGPDDAGLLLWRGRFMNTSDHVVTPAMGTKVSACMTVRALLDGGDGKGADQLACRR